MLRIDLHEYIIASRERIGIIKVTTKVQIHFGPGPFLIRVLYYVLLVFESLLFFVCVLYVIYVVYIRMYVHVGRITPVLRYRNSGCKMLALLVRYRTEQY